MVPDFDFKNPDYPAVFRRRAEVLKKLRADPDLLKLVKTFYRDNPAQFISDWGCTVDPRNVERRLPALVPFILFPRQVEWVEWIVDHWRRQLPGLTEKSRDMGMSWLAIGLSCTLCVFHPGMSIGFGSRKEEYVDKIGSPKSLFYKARVFMQNLPVEFRAGFIAERDAPHLRLNFPETGSNISGEAGDNIGRGDRAAIYFVDESAFLERPLLVEASLSQTTNCRQDISSANGMANPFAQKRHSGRIDVFTFYWRDDPRKDQAWRDKQDEILDEVVIAQEIEIDYSASVSGVVIPVKWIRASIDAHIRLNVKPTGSREGAMDIADEGPDRNAFCMAHGILVEDVIEWSGNGKDVFWSVEKAFDLCDEHDLKRFRYDADGMGAAARGDARILNEKRKKEGKNLIDVTPFRGSEGVVRPDSEDVKGRKNADYFYNHKSQSWIRLQTLFKNTYRAVVEGKPFHPDEIISISSKMRLREQLISELSQVTYAENGVGKILINKTPDGTKSPNLADAVMIRFAPMQNGIPMTKDYLDALKIAVRR